MIQHGIDPLAQASESYTTDLPLQERLGDLLAYAAATGRLTDDEVELVETSVTVEARIRHQAQRQCEEHQQWLADQAAKQREHQRESQRRWEELTDASLRRRAHYEATGIVTYPDDPEPSAASCEADRQEAETC
jgi:hypothetical protein